MNWYTSDLHFYHKNIIQYSNRPFSSIEEMNQTMINRWNEKVGENDTVHVVGDVFFCSFTEAKKIMDQLKGKKILYIGNHDRFKAGQLTELGFSEFYSNPQKKLIHGKQIMISHYPYKPTDKEIMEINASLKAKGVDKDLNFKRNLNRSNMWLIHGHVHNSWRVKETQINVGVDVWNFYPVSEDEIITIINK